MQRRAVAVAAGLLLIVGALSLGLVLTSEAPALNAAEDSVYQEGDQFTVDGQTYTVATVEASESSGGGHGGGGGVTYEAVIEWQNESGATQSASVGQHGNVTLSGETFFAHFESGEEVVISSNFETLRQYNTDTDRYQEHTDGLWGVSILTGVTVIMLMGMAYLPSRY